jgi:hypothetical protein
MTDNAPTKGKQQAQILKQWAQQKAMDVEDARQVVLHLLKGKKVVGYHLHQKLREF